MAWLSIWVPVWRQPGFAVRVRRLGKALAALALGFGCAGSPVQGLLGREPEPRDAAASEAPRVYYTAEEDLPLYASPGGRVVTRLPLHQKLLRYRLERGFAFVRVDGSDHEGWVDNARLIWRLPSRSEPGAPEPASPGVPAPATVSEPEPSAPEAPAASPAAAETAPAGGTQAAPASEPASPTGSAPAADPAPAPGGGGPDPSIFDPF